jgi:hypothetical protein
MSRWLAQVLHVQELLGPHAVVYEQAHDWIIAIVKNPATGPPYDLEYFGAGETFDAAYTQASRAAAKIKKPTRTP